MTTLDAVVERIVSGYAPERIIVFGSHASGEAREGSDVDLLIVKETDQRPLERRLAVERLLADREVPLDLFVYTPVEVRRLHAAGSPLIEEIVENGRVLYMRKATEALLAEARDEMESASILLEHAKYRGACLHSQQCVEKALKALILERGKCPIRTHDVVELLNTARAEGWQIALTTDDAVYLNSIYRGLYPTEEGLLPRAEPSDEDASRAVRVATRSLGHIESLLTSSTI